MPGIGLLLGGFAIILFWATKHKPTSQKSLPDRTSQKSLTPSDGEVSKAVDAVFTDVNQFASPLNGVSDEQWRGFTKWAQQGKLGTITPGYRLGMYLIDTRQLEDIGMMKNVRKVKYQGRDAYNGEWVAPQTLQGFLSSPLGQYTAFEEIISRWGRAIQGGNLLGKTIAGDVATLSGLLGAAKLAGFQGMLTWAKDPTKFPSTTRAYTETNGKF